MGRPKRTMAGALEPFDVSRETSRKAEGHPDPAFRPIDSTSTRPESEPGTDESVSGEDGIGIWRRWPGTGQERVGVRNHNDGQRPVTTCRSQNHHEGRETGNKHVGVGVGVCAGVGVDENVSEPSRECVGVRAREPPGEDERPAS